jgi:hypothetical protein
MSDQSRITNDEWQEMARSLAQTIKPGTIIGRRSDQIPVDESEHFYVCEACKHAVDMRDLGQVFHHAVPGHEPLPEN